MIEHDQHKSLLLSKLGQGLQNVFNEVVLTEAKTNYGPEITLSVGELNGMRTDPDIVGKARVLTYFYYSFRAEFIPDREEIEEQISSSIARDRTHKVSVTPSPPKPIVDQEAILLF